ncbi:tyrosine recombinase XerC [Streptomyces sp. NPDC017966]|uniref:tyrosine recombinase XerC n=1 Tax=Streptomyces sp. NPDC017966 TaxID=3365023 RepID=UPI0037AD9AAE
MGEIKKITLRNGKTRYRAVVDAGRDENGKRVQITITKDTKTEVKNERSRIEHQRAAGTLVLPSKVTVAEWIDDWLALKARDIEETTLSTYRYALAPARKQLGHIRVQALTEDEVQAFIDQQVTSGRKRGGEPGSTLRVTYVKGTLQRLRECLARAVVRKVITSNPAEFVKVSLADRKRDRREHRREQPWNVDEVQTFIKGIEQDRLYAPLLLSLMGLRPAEVVGMRWDDVDLKLGTLETANTRTMLGGRVIEKDAKTVAGDRVLPLPSKASDALKRFRALQAREKLAAGEGYTDSPYVVVNQLGEPMTTRQLRDYAYRLMRDLGMRRVRLYDARHSCLTYLAAVVGVPDVVLARWAGHTSAAFTKSRYVLPDVEALRPAATAWDQFHGGDTAES